MTLTPRSLITLLGLTFIACSQGNGVVPTEADHSATETDGLSLAISNQRIAVHRAIGDYQFVVPADFNGGIFGGRVGNRLTFEAYRDASGVVSGQYRYLQRYKGENFIFSGSVTCFLVYDTPTLERFPEIPPMTQNRAKWGGRINRSTDPTIPVGTFIWFQSIDNGPDAGEDEAVADNPGQRHPDLSTLSGFGDEAANEAFCNSETVPNTNFGPHAVEEGKLRVE